MINIHEERPRVCYSSNLLLRLIYILTILSFEQIMNKRIFTIPMLLILSLSTVVRGQELSFIRNNIGTTNNAHIESIYNYRLTPEWKKYKILKASAWTAFGVGGAMLTGGCIGDAIDNYEVGTNGIKKRFRVVWCIGIGVTLSSIPLFIYAHKNKKKALSISATNQTIFMPMQVEQQPALALRFSF